FQPAAQRRAMQRRHNRLGAVFDLADYIGQPWLLQRLAEFPDIGAGNKGTAFANQQQYLCIAVGFPFLECILQARPYSVAQGVDRWVVDGNNPNLSLTLVTDDL